MGLDELPPCYNAVIVEPPPPGTIPVATVQSWLMDENGNGEFVSTGNPGCK
jgi:hypothetical protein